MTDEKKQIKAKKSKKGFIEVKQELTKYFIDNKLSARDMLMVLRDLETDAILILMLAQKFKNEQKSKEKLPTTHDS